MVRTIKIFKILGILKTIRNIRAIKKSWEIFLDYSECHHSACEDCSESWGYESGRIFGFKLLETTRIRIIWILGHSRILKILRSTMSKS